MGTTVGEAEKLLILKTLEATNNNKTRAAEILGISLKTLHNKLKEYGSSPGGHGREWGSRVVSLQSSVFRQPVAPHCRRLKT